MEKPSIGKKDLVPALVAGFALFATFFGAGNLIFPPMLGMSGGKQWWLAFGVFLLADAGLAVAGVLAILKSEGTMDDMASPLGKIPGRLACLLMMIVIGPLVTVPRTCATTYDLSISPLLPGFSPLLFSLLFFAIVAALTIRPGSVVDIIGKFLTPALLLTLLVLCVKGIITPLGAPADPAPEARLARQGLLAGYQTMDALSALPLSVIILKSVTDKGYTERREKGKIVTLACLVAFLGLLAVYAGLSYLGATASGIDAAAGLSNTDLLVFITNGLLDRTGVILLAVIVFLACLTTAVGIGSSVADYLSHMTGGKLSYPAAVLLICACGIGLSVLGTQSILRIAEPVLTLLYPLFLILIFMSFLAGRFKNPRLFRAVVRGASLAALLYTLLTIPATYFGVWDIPFLNRIPLAELGLGWLLPALMGGILGGLLFRKNTH